MGQVIYNILSLPYNNVLLRQITRKKKPFPFSLHSMFKGFFFYLCKEIKGKYIYISPVQWPMKCSLFSDRTDFKFEK